jgi:hypothetical protein
MNRTGILRRDVRRRLMVRCSLDTRARRFFDVARLLGGFFQCTRHRSAGAGMKTWAGVRNAQHPAVGIVLAAIPQLTVTPPRVVYFKALNNKF